MEKNIIIYRGPTASYKPELDRNFVERQAKERSLK